MQMGRLWASIVGNNAKQKFLLVIPLLGGFDENVPITILIKGTGVKYLIFTLKSPATCILIHKVLVGELVLRVFVEEFHVGVLGQRSGQTVATQGQKKMYRGGVVKMEMCLFDTLSMIALRVG